MRRCASNPIYESRPAARGALFGLALALVATCAHAVAPQLNTILPRGGQRGTEVEVNFRGRNLADAVDVMFHSEGITLVEITPNEDGEGAKAKLAIAPDCALGVHAMRVRTKTGVSNLELFSVGNLPEIEENEPNDDPDAPQAVALNNTINGRVTSEDVDYFGVELPADGRLAVETEAIRLGGALFDIKLRLFDPKGIELVAEDDTALLRQDAGFVFVAKEAGQHVLAVSEASYGGNGNYRYRLHVGNFPRPFAVTPMGGAPGVETQVTWLGDPALSTQTLVVPAVEKNDTSILPVNEAGAAPTPLPFRLSPYPGVSEVEPNNSLEQATVGAAPGAFDGVIQEDEDTDWFAFEGKKDQVFDVRLWARALGSPLDPVMTLSQPTENKQIASDDDARGVDSFFRVTLPEDGLYKLWIADHLRRGAPTFAYRVEVTPVTPALTFRAEQNERALLAIPRGNHNVLLLVAQREEFDAEIALAFENLPAGVTAEILPMAQGETLRPIVFNAASDAPVAGHLVDIVGTSGDIKGRFDQQVVLVYGNNKTIFADYRPDRLATVVTDEAPFSIEIKPTTVPIVQNSTKLLRIVAKRAEGFAEPINLRVPWLPNGYGAGTATIPGDQTEVDLLLEAKGAEPGTVDVIVLAESAGWQVCTPKTPIQVTPQWVSFQVANVEVEQGQAKEIVVQVTQTQPYEGTFEAVMTALPGGVTTTPQPFTKDTTELRFPLTVAPEAPAGKHTAMYIETTLTANEEPIRHISGGAEMKIYEPLPPELQQAAAPEPAPDQPKEEAPERKTRFPGSTQ